MSIESLDGEIKRIEDVKDKAQEKAEAEQKAAADLQNKINALQAEVRKHEGKVHEFETAANDAERKRLAKAEEKRRLVEMEAKKLKAANDNNASGMKKAG